MNPKPKTKKKRRIKRTFSRGLTKKFSNEYWIWQSMLSRCNNPQNHGYKNYGGRGISVCEQWETFDKFLEDMGSRPEGKSLDRIDNNKGYSKENCRWATAIEQQNNRRNNHIIEFNNQKKTIIEWARTFNIRPDTLMRRINQGWPLDQALKLPLVLNATETETWKATRRQIGKHIEFRGKKQNIAAWARELNMRVSLIYNRLEHGWSIERTLTTPKLKNSGNYGKTKKTA